MASEARREALCPTGGFFDKTEDGFSPSVYFALSYTTRWGDFKRDMSGDMDETGSASERFGTSRERLSFKGFDLGVRKLSSREFGRRTPRRSLSLPVSESTDSLSKSSPKPLLPLETGETDCGRLFGAERGSDAKTYTSGLPGCCKSASLAEVRPSWLFSVTATDIMGSGALRRTIPPRALNLWGASRDVRDGPATWTEGSSRVAVFSLSALLARERRGSLERILRAEFRPERLSAESHGVVRSFRADEAPCLLR